ncbi:MAG: hypothetical protein H7Y04_02305 [Verrucomicrobia bacterium]|nr:hypothetical protein [Cytophagales bacterium]
MKSNLLSLLLVFIYFTVSAQYSNTSHEEAVDVKKKTLLIALDEQDIAMVNKLKKEPEKLKAYQDFIAGKNEAMKNAVQKIWTFSKYEFKPAKEATRLVTSKKTAYMLLKFSSIGDYTYTRSSQGINSAPSGYSYNKNMGGYSYNAPAGEMKKTGDVPILSLASTKEILKVNLPTAYPSEGEMMFALGHLQYILAYLAENEKHGIMNLIKKQLDVNVKFLKDKTLLVDTEDLKKGVTEDEIKAAYGFPVKAVSSEEIDKALINKTFGYAVIKIIPVEIGGGGVKAHVIADTENSLFYYFDYVKNTNISGISVGKKVEFLQEKDFKNIAKAITDK